MFSTLRTRYGIPALISTVALVFAMTGGAFAAKYLITSTKQISPSVLKKLKGKAGAAGAAGATGAQGPAGAAGANGEKGAPGTNGTNGKDGQDGQDGADGESVKVKEGEGFECNEGGVIVEEEGGGSSLEVCNGEPGQDGEKGKEGSPWTAGGTLPPGATLTGTWSFNGAGSGEEGEHYVPISFPIQLAAGMPEKDTLYGNPTKPSFSAICKGQAKAPTAPPGKLCVYEQEVVGVTPGFIASIELGNGVDKAGGFLFITGAGAGDYGYGSWAVTGCSKVVGEPFPCP